MRSAAARLSGDQDGGVLVEGTIIISLFLIFVFGSIDFLMAMYQWNSAAKAVAVGARIAAVSSPVSSDISAMTGLDGGAAPGDSFPNFTRTCNGATASCSNGGSFSAAALNTIVYGRSNATACGDQTSFYDTGMCDIFSRIAPANVVITYTQTGLGYAGRPGGPVPTITVSLQNINFQFYFLAGLLGFGNITIPGMTTTITGEDLSSSAPL
jgi:Flp pilus assembly protein TadG